MSICHRVPLRLIMLRELLLDYVLLYSAGCVYKYASLIRPPPTPSFQPYPPFHTFPYPNIDQMYPPPYAHTPLYTLRHHSRSVPTPSSATIPTRVLFDRPCNHPPVARPIALPSRPQDFVRGHGRPHVAGPGRHHPLVPVRFCSGGGRGENSVGSEAFSRAFI